MSPLKAIPFQALQAEWAEIRSDALAAVDRVGNSGHWILGEQVASFEMKLAEFWGLPHAVGCGNGLDAIEIALRALGAAPGDRVVTTPLSAFATTLGALRAGCVPVFADVDESGNLDLAQAERAIRESRATFLLPVHLYGNPIDLGRLADLVKSTGVRLIEDCAQAIGARFGGNMVGSVGDMAITSFYPTKNLGAIGDGGALLTRDPALAAKAKQIRDYGQSAKYEHTMLGLNSRLDELHAAMLNSALLPRLNDFTSRRRAIAGRYLAELRSAHLRPLKPNPKAEPVWHLFPLFVKGDREKFRAHLKENGVDSAIHYPKLITAQAALIGKDGATRAAVPKAEAIAQQEVSIPLHPYLTDGQVEQIIGACNSWKG